MYIHLKVEQSLNTIVFYWRCTMAMTTYNCLNCSLRVTKKNSRSKYCSHKCQWEHHWKTIGRARVLSGKTSPSSVSTLKRYLSETRNECWECGCSNIWNNKPLTLQLDHIDGNSDNTKVENLRLLCPNCHTQTSTFGNAGKGSRYKKCTKRNKYLQEYKTSRG